MEDLDFNNIDDSLSFNFFGNEDDEQKDDVSVEETDNNNDNDNTENTVDIDPESLFDDDSESVGEEDKQDTKNPEVQEEPGNSSADFYSSIASALKNDGVLEYLDDDSVASITDADTFKSAIETEIKSRFDSKQQELLDAMGYGADVQELNYIQNTIDYLNKIDPESLKDDSNEQITQLRKDLIASYYQNLGMNEDQVNREVKKSFDAGTDIEDAQNALITQKQFYQQLYDNKINTAKLEEEKRQAEMQLHQKKVIDTIMETEEPFSGIKLDKRVRGKIVSNVYDPSVLGKDGHYYSKLQMYQMENPEDFLQKVGTIFTITDGFKNFDKLVGKVVNTKNNENIRDLENKLKNQKNYGTSFRYVSKGRGEQQKPNSRYTLNI